MSKTPQSHQIRTEYGNINYYKRGTGAKTMLCFHGFGQDGLTMAPLAEAVFTEYTAYCFDLFYHGNTFWTSEEKPIEKTFWVNLLNQFFENNNITKFSITAFSLGGKMALVTTEYFTPQIERLILIAPDGVKTQTWYNLANYPLIFQKYVKTIIVKPQRFHRLINFLKAIKVLDSGIIKFANSQMDTISKRKRVYYSWVSFKKMTTDIKKVATLINASNIPVTLYLGEYDKIITENGMNVFTNLLTSVTVNKLSTGHNDLIDHIVENARS